MASNGSGTELWSSPSSMLHSYQPYAIKNSLILWATFLPSLFVVFTARREERLWRMYLSSIIYASLAQCFLTLPIALWQTALAFASDNVPLALGACSFFRTLATVSSNAGYMVPPTLSISRFCAIVLQRAISLRAIVAINVALTIPGIVYGVIVMFFGRASKNDVCSVLLKAPDPIIAQLYALSVFLSTLVGVGLNLWTLHFVREQRKKAGRKLTEDDFSVAIGMTVQSIVPLFLSGAGVLTMILYIAGIFFPPWLNSLINVLDPASVGLNVVCSFAFVRSFRSRLFPCGGEGEEKKGRRTEPNTTTTMIM